LAFGSLTGQVQSIQGVDLGGSSSRSIAINALGGNVGIGTAAPSQNLHVAGNTLFATSSGSIESGFTSGGSNAYALLYAQSTSGTLYMGVNGTAAGSPVDVTGILDNASYFGSRTNHATQFLTNNTVRATIDSSGNLLVGTTTVDGSSSNTARVVGGIFSSFKGEVSSAATNTSYTMFDTGANYACYIVSVIGIAADAPNYSTTAVVNMQNTSVQASRRTKMEYTWTIAQMERNTVQ
jgi:hypothetical protein